MLIQRFDIELTLKQCCFNVVCLLGCAKLVQRRFESDCSDAQAALSCRHAHTWIRHGL